MQVFLEKQFVNRWWLIMFILAIIVIIFGTAFYATENAEEDTAVVVSVICCLIGIPIVFALLFIRLETRMDEKGVFTYFRPFWFSKSYYAWEEIEKCYVRTYSPVGEFGGWGYRLWGGSKGYIISGNKGIQIETRNGKKCLIGTQKPKKAQEIIDQYKPAIDNEI